MNSKNTQLTLQTLSLVSGFMVWVLLSSLMTFIKDDIALTPDQIALVTSVPVILGSLLRILFGFWTNRFGARKMFIFSLLFLLFPVYYISQAESFMELLIGGILLGIGGANFSIGVTSLPKYFPKERHGFVNGIYGVGNMGTAITAFLAPILAGTLGWSITTQLFMVLLVVFALLNFFFGDRHEEKVKAPLMVQIKSVYRDEKLWFLSIFYFITFGSFVAFTIYLPNFLVAHFHLDKVDAGLRTAGFIALSTLIRPLGGWLADKFNPFKILMIVFAGLTFSGILLSFMPSITFYTIGCLAIAFCGGIGNGTIFKLVPLYYSKQAGVVNGIVAAMGGFGGFFPPLILALLFNLTGHYAIGFMALSQVALASLILVIWMYYQDKLKLKDQIFEYSFEGIMVTDTKGKISLVNKAFTTVTGYEPDEVLGKSPRILKSGHHDRQFYIEMWETLKTNGLWQGEIWNRRKNGEVYLEWLTISAIQNEGGEVKNYAGRFSDITEYRQIKKDSIKPQGG